jgi:hypothetical protein
MARFVNSRGSALQRAGSSASRVKRLNAESRFASFDRCFSQLLIVRTMMNLGMIFSRFEVCDHLSAIRHFL